LEWLSIVKVTAEDADTSASIITTDDFQKFFGIVDSLDRFRMSHQVKKHSNTT
jgi:hypothetical protein